MHCRCLEKYWFVFGFRRRFPDSTTIVNQLSKTRVCFSDVMGWGGLLLRLAIESGFKTWENFPRRKNRVFLPRKAPSQIVRTHQTAGPRGRTPTPPPPPRASTPSPTEGENSSRGVQASALPWRQTTLRGSAAR